MTELGTPNIFTIRFFTKIHVLLDSWIRDSIALRDTWSVDLNIIPWRDSTTFELLSTKRLRYLQVAITSRSISWCLPVKDQIILSKDTMRKLKYTFYDKTVFTVQIGKLWQTYKSKVYKLWLAEIVQKSYIIIYQHDALLVTCLN
jgi:hypothetical protein